MWPHILQLIVLSYWRPKGNRRMLTVFGTHKRSQSASGRAAAPQLLASDWWIGGWKQRTCSTGMFSPSPDFMYLFRMAKISSFRTWNLRILSTIFFRGWRKHRYAPRYHIFNIDTHLGLGKTSDFPRCLPTCSFVTMNQWCEMQHILFEEDSQWG